MAIFNFQFTHQDPDNKRAYYKDKRGGIYCIQDDSSFLKPALLFYSCTPEGEPLVLHYCDKREFEEMVLPDSLLEKLTQYANSKRDEQCPF